MLTKLSLASTFAVAIAFVSCREEIPQPPVTPPQSYQYVDVNPDVLFSSSVNYGEPRTPLDSVAVCDVDLDGDQLSDLRLSTSHWRTYVPPSYRDCEGTGVEILNPQFSVFIQSSNGLVHLLDSGDALSNVYRPYQSTTTQATTWKDTLYTGITWNIPGPLNPPTQNINGTRYIGFYKEVGTAKYYGWLRFTQVNGLTLRVEEYAIGQVPNVDMIAGDH
jgi:hypothetical protein